MKLRNIDSLLETKKLGHFFANSIHVKLDLLEMHGLPYSWELNMLHLSRGLFKDALLRGRNIKNAEGDQLSIGLDPNQCPLDHKAWVLLMLPRSKF